MLSTHISQDNETTPWHEADAGAGPHEVRFTGRSCIDAAFLQSHRAAVCLSSRVDAGSRVNFSPSRVSINALPFSVALDITMSTSIAYPGREVKIEVVPHWGTARSIRSFLDILHVLTPQSVRSSQPSVINRDTCVCSKKHLRCRR